MGWQAGGRTWTVEARDERSLDEVFEAVKAQDSVGWIMSWVVLVVLFAAILLFAAAHPA